MYEYMIEQTSLIHRNEAFLWPNISKGRGILQAIFDHAAPSITRCSVGIRQDGLMRR